MKHLITALTILIFTGATSQVQAPTQDKKLTLILSVQDVDVVLNALQQLPYKDAAGVIQSIYGQAQRQLNDTIKKK